MLTWALKNNEWERPMPVHAFEIDRHFRDWKPSRNSQSQIIPNQTVSKRKRLKCQNNQKECLYFYKIQVQASLSSLE